MSNVILSMMISLDGSIAGHDRLPELVPDGPTYLARWTDLLPHADVLRIEDAGHWPHEEASERVAGHISAFLHQEQPGDRAELYS